MTQRHSSREDGYFVLAAWCTVSKAWQEQPEQYDSVWEAQAAATARGIYRVIYLRDGRRLNMEPFAIVGDD